MPRKVTWVDRGDIYYRGERCLGLADRIAWLIEIDTTLHRSPRQLLFTELEELIHLLHPELSERQAKRDAAFLGSELWRRGYKTGVNRRTK